ncbi:MAG: hypothetical protein IKE52_02060 [Mogibacterium sp.]|nr:hypothetical protein [Mogibacterium sp.]
MRYAFIVNPAAGTGGHDKGIVRRIQELIFECKDKEIGLYYTSGAEESTALAAMLAKEAKKANDEIVVFGCGGDGTVHEVANGIYGYENAILGIVPIGSGNDLVRELSRDRGNFKDYLNMNMQLAGSPGSVRELDVMELSWEDEGQIKSCISVNNINIGFDGNTAVRASELKEKPLISGSFAYLLAVFSTLVKKEGQSLRITADGEDFHDGDLLLTTMGNGGYCGGGIRSCPFALMDDGLIELMAINDVSRMRFIRLFPRFRAGRIFETENIEKLIKYRRAKRITIEPLLADKMKFVTDGEVLETGKLTIQIQPRKLRIWEMR